MSQTTTQPYSTVEERLEILKRSRDLDSRVIAGDNGGTSGCKFDIDIPRDVWSRISTKDEDVYAFLQTQGLDTLMKAYLNVTNVTLPRASGEGHLECRVNEKGWECGGGIRIRF